MHRSLPLYLESLLLLVLAVAAGLGFNALRSDGLEIGRNYFPAAAAADGQAPAHDFQKVTADYIEEMLDYLDRDGRGGEGGYFLVDARSETAWREGHIPGAILCDHYHQKRYLTPELLEALRQAAQVIVYCNGGDCPDSVSLAFDLVFEYGVPGEVVAIYEGGMAEWRAQGRREERSR